MSIPEPTVEHHEGRGSSCPIFSEMRPILDEAFEIFGDKCEYVVAAQQYRAAANTAMGWKNSNLRTEMTRLPRRRLRLATIVPYCKASRRAGQPANQTTTRVPAPCGLLLGCNSPRIAQQSYLLVAEDDFAREAGMKKVMVEGRVLGGVGKVS